MENQRKASHFPSMVVCLFPMDSLTAVCNFRPHDINDAIGTYVMAAEGCGKTGKFLQSSRVHRYNRAADDVKLQDKLLQELEKLTGVEPPTTQSELKTVSLAARIEQSGHSPSDSPSS